jgi:hypothetical protein
MKKWGYRNAVKIDLRFRDRRHVFTQKERAVLSVVLNAEYAVKVLGDYANECAVCGIINRQEVFGLKLCAALFGEGLTKGLCLTYEGFESELGGEIARMIRRLSAECYRFAKRRAVPLRENPFDTPVLMICRQGGWRLAIKTDCQAVLAAMAILRDEGLPQGFRTEKALKTLTAKRARFLLPLMSINAKEEMLGGIFAALSGEKENGREASSGKRRSAVIDPVNDPPLIYADFLAFYNIDLRKRRLPWRMFLQMIAALPGDCAVQNALAARADAGGCGFQQGAERLFDTLMGLAGEKAEYY